MTPLPPLTLWLSLALSAFTASQASSGPEPAIKGWVWFDNTVAHVAWGCVTSQSWDWTVCGESSQPAPNDGRGFSSTHKSYLYDICVRYVDWMKTDWGKEQEGVSKMVVTRIASLYPRVTCAPMTLKTGQNHQHWFNLQLGVKCHVWQININTFKMKE